MRGLLGLGLVMMTCACVTPEAAPRRAYEAPSWASLSRFNGEDDFRAYLRAVDDARNHDRDTRNLYFKEGVEAELECTPDDPGCAGEEEEAIVVTSSRISSSSASMTTAITNVQTLGVDEGDIVKMIGRFLVVLQDGRLFVADTGRNARDLRLVDRANVYTRDDSDAWYDEILVHENRILVTGFSYEQEATEFTVFSLSPSGRLTREGAYYLSSNDYYDGDNYATRLVDGNLVIYTPLGDLESAGETRWPLVRRWLREGEDGALLTQGRSLFDAYDIYRPIQATYEPTIHTISVCPLGSPRAGDELECRSTAMVGPRRREFYVSNDNIYLWLYHGREYPRDEERECAENAETTFGYADEAALFQIDIRDGRPRAMFVRGMPNDQLGLEESTGQFRALSVWWNFDCNNAPEELPLRYFATPTSAFSTNPERAPESAFTPVPSAGGRGLENRFTAGHLVYGGRDRWSSYAYDDADEDPPHGRIVAVPTSNPSAAQVIEAPHQIIRVESIGEDAVVTGYGAGSALNVSIVDLSASPQIADTAVMAGRYETEGRSHAFNASIEENGSGLLGLPTGQAQWRSGRWVWDSESSDVSFLALDANGGLATLGELVTAKDGNVDPAYECDVSCVDWYGNSRPIFADGRIYALSGTELIEGRVAEGRIVELARLNLTTPRRRR